MKKYLVIIILAVAAMPAKANIQYYLRYKPLTDSFYVSFISDQNYPAGIIIGGSNATVVFDNTHYNTAAGNAAFVVTGMLGGAASFSIGDRSDGTLGSVNNKKLVIFGTTGFSYAPGVTSGTEYTLFRFTFGAGNNCSGFLRLFVNSIDPSDPDGFGGDFGSFMNIGFQDKYSTNVDASNQNCASLTPVPVRFLAFTAVKSGNDGLLNWQVGNEDANTDHYEVERSVNRIDFAVVKSVPALHNGRAITGYDMRDPNIIALKTNAIYYRIKQYDRDGRFVTSEIKTLWVKDNAYTLSLYPNPARSFINVETDLAQAGAVSMRITDGSGKEVSRTDFKGNSGINIQRVNIANLAAGRYVMTVLMGTETQSIPFVKSN